MLLSIKNITRLMDSGDIDDWEIRRIIYIYKEEIIDRFSHCIDPCRVTENGRQKVALICKAY